MLRCPDCDKELEYVIGNYTETVYGTADVYGEDDYDCFETQDSENFEWEYYECPECRYQSDDLDEFIVTEDEYLPEDPPSPSGNYGREDD